MIITSRKPYTAGEIEKLKEEFEVYVKTVIDLKRKVCSAGANRHFESEEILLGEGSQQSDLWGGGIDLAAGTVNFDSMINIRPQENNRSNEIQDPAKRAAFEELTKFFFQEALNEPRN
ncbi:MAG: DUF5674 family protein [Patescibacteria group bacterium]